MRAAGGERARAPRGKARALLAILPLGFLALGFAVPLWVTAREAFSDPSAWEWARGDYVVSTLRMTAWQATLSTLLALAVAVPLAWLHHVRRVPFARVHLALHALPFAMPVFVVVYGLQSTLGKTALWQALGPLGAVVVAHAYYNYGLAARLIHAALERRPRLLEDAARTLGASRTAAALRTTLPLLAPAVLGAALLVFLFSFASFGTVLYLGNGEVRTLETVLFGYLGIVPDHARAAVLGLLQLGVNGLLLLGYLALRRRLDRARLQPDSVRPRQAGIAVQLVALAAGAAALTPLAAVLVGGFRLAGEWSLEPWRSVLAHPGGFDLGAALGRSLAYAAGSTLVAVGLTACIAAGPAWLRRHGEAIAGIPLAQSAMLMALGLTVAYGPGSPLALVGTPWILVLAHALIAFPFVARALLPALATHDERLDEAAATLGAPPRDVLRRVQWPALRPAIGVAAATAVTLSLGDFGATTALSRNATRPLVAWVPLLDGPFNPLLHARAVALTGFLALLVLAATVAFEWAARREART